MSTDTTPSRRDERYAGFYVVAAMVAVMWLVEVVDEIDDHKLDGWGIRPHHLDRLVGIITAPFLHSGFDHLIANTVPFAILGFAIAFSGLTRVLAVTAIVVGVGGLGTWLIAPSNTIHIGASGVVFGYATYLVFRGVFTGRVPELLLGAAVAAVWGSALLSGLVPHDGISWQGHLCGALGGIGAAVGVGREGRKPKTANALVDV